MELVELMYNRRVVELVELSNRRVVEWCSCQILVWWNGGVSAAFEASNGGMVELVAFSSRRMVE